MKKLLTLIVCLLGLANCNSQSTSQTLQLANCNFALELVEGDQFSFPDTLAKLGLKLTHTATGYKLEGNEIPFHTSGESVTIDGDNVNGDVIVGGKVITTNNGTITIIQGNGTITTYSSTSTTAVETPKPIQITVPKNLKLNAITRSDLYVSADLAELHLNLTGSSSVSIQNVTMVSSINITGSAVVNIASADTIGSLNISGSGDIIIADCPSIGDVNISGAGDVHIEHGKTIGFLTVSGLGNIYLHGDIQTEGESISGLGAINRLQ